MKVAQKLFPLLVVLAAVGCDSSSAPPTDAAIADVALADSAADLAPDQLLPGPDMAVADDLAAPQDPGGVIWRGFAIHWEQTPHRINKIGSSVTSAPNSGGLHVTTTSIMEGGSWSTGQRASDKVQYKVAYSAVRSQAVQIAEGVLATVKVYGDAKSEPEVVAETTQQVRVSLPQQMRQSGGTLHLLLRGFNIDTDITHVDGYTVRGIAVKLANVTRDADELVADLTVRMQAGVVFDRIQNLDSYGASVEVHYSVVNLLAGSATDSSVAYSLDLAGGIYPTHDPAGADKAAHAVGLSSGADQALVGLRGFSFYLNRDKTFPGRYMRSLTVSNDGPTVDASKSLVDLWTDGFFSNSGAVTHATTVEFAADTVVLQLQDPGAKVVHDHVEGTAGVLQVTDERDVAF